jgi:hypothetical protein
MKKNILLSLSMMMIFFACQESPTKTMTETSDISADSTAITTVIHDFYEWYGDFVMGEKSIIFIKEENGHNVLDLPLLDEYLAKFQATELVSNQFIDRQIAYYRACEKIWQKESADDIPSGLDADKYFCGQDYDINFWIKSPVRLESIDGNKVIATMYGMEGDLPKEQNFELVKENNKWLLSEIECDMGIDF